MRDPKEDYRKWIFEGECPCCFPYWDYGDSVSVADVWGWQGEFHAWDVYEEILGEYDDE